MRTLRMVYHVPPSEFAPEEFNADAEVTKLPAYYQVVERYVEDGGRFVSDDGADYLSVEDLGDPDNTHLVRIEFAHADERAYNIAHHEPSDP